MNAPPPTLQISVPTGRDYGTTLQQTKMVYDQLLADKHGKLLTAIHQKKLQFDVQCADMARKSKDKAMELGVKAQAEINGLIAESDEELFAIRDDYQIKLNKMREQLENTWEAKQK